jgi:hypothetical protein
MFCIWLTFAASVQIGRGFSLQYRGNPFRRTSWAVVDDNLGKFMK